MKNNPPVSPVYPCDGRDQKDAQFSLLGVPRCRIGQRGRRRWERLRAALPGPAMNSLRRIVPPAASAAASRPRNAGERATSRLPPGLSAAPRESLVGPVQAPPASAAASGRWGAPVAGVVPTVEGRATPCRRPQSKQVPRWRPRSLVAPIDPFRHWLSSGPSASRRRIAARNRSAGDYEFAPRAPV
jgi:hypothetical protein